MIPADRVQQPGRNGAVEHLAGRLSRLVPVRRDIAGLGLAIVAVLAYAASGAAAANRDAFVFMGFDTDRAYLLAGGLGCAIGAGAAAAVGSRRAIWALAGLVGLAGIFGLTYLGETVRALQASPEIGRFDPAGWLLGTLALASSGLALGWSIGVLVNRARLALMPVLATTVAALRRRRVKDLPARGLAAVIVTAALLGLSVPVLGQMLNYGPDTLMLGGAQGIPLVGENAATAPSLPDIPSGSPSMPGITGGGGPSQGRGAAPWLAWRPTGQGNVVAEQLNAPWIGGSSRSASFSVYLPPGYAAASRRYPVVYELPWAIGLYDQGAQVRALLDAAIDSGRIPATIVVFLTSGGGPFVDNECIDAAGGREWFDTFVGSTLVGFVDSHFRTIPSPDARSLMGMSQGGFCAANVLLHHPGVFHQEISFAGYYWAAPLLGISPSARAPYAGDTQLAIGNSPVLEVPGLSPIARSSLLFTLVGNPVQPFYGPQMTAFAALLRKTGVAVDEIDTVYGHSWTAVRVTLAAALEAVAAREAAEGVFSAS
jgi:enterochelin esterase-like enzyme